MKKLRETCIFISGVFIFLAITYGITLEKNNVVIFIYFMSNAVKVFFAVAGFILVWNNLTIRINNRANMMAICYLLSSFLIVALMSFFIYSSHTFPHNPMYIKENLQCNIYEVLFLVICINWIDEECDIKKWIVLVVSMTSISVILCFISLPIDPYLIKYGYTMQMKIATAIVLAVVILLSQLRARKQGHLMSLKERRVFKRLYSVKLICLLLVVVLSVWKWNVLNVVYYILETLNYLFIFGYIEESTLSITAKKINRELLDKEEEIVRMQIEGKILAASAAQVENIIESMSKKAEKLAGKIIHRDIKQDIDYIEKIEKNCNRLIKLSNNIMTINNYGKGALDVQFERIDLAKLVANIASSIEPYMRQKQLDMQYYGGSKEVWCDVDVQAIERIVLNLISNSVKYTESGGNIRIFVLETENRVRIVVQDTGVGIPEELLVDVFSRFIRVESKLTRQQEGSGLGLAIVKSLVDLHNGEIHIKSKLNKGTNIMINLPLRQNREQIAIEGRQKSKELLKKRVEVEFSDIGV